MDNVIFPQLPTYVGSPDLAGLLSLGITILLPVLAAIFMKSSWSAGRKGFVLLIFAAVKGFLEAWLAAANDGAAFNTVGVAYSILVSFTLAVVAYVGLLKGTAVQQAALHSGVKDR